MFFVNAEENVCVSPWLRGFNQKSVLGCRLEVGIQEVEGTWQGSSTLDEHKEGDGEAKQQAENQKSDYETRHGA